MGEDRNRQAEALKRRSLLLTFLVGGGLLIGAAALHFFSSSYRRGGRPEQSIPRQTTRGQAPRLVPPPPLPGQIPLLFSEYDPANDVLSLYSANYNGSGKQKLAILPDSNVKSLQSLDQNTFLYLGGLDGMGRGDGVYRLTNGQESKLIPAPKGFVFDQMYLSPDKQKLVVWEFEDKFYLRESTSRLVLYKNITSTPRRKVLIEQKGSTGRVFYPVSWSPDGRTIYADTLDPDGGGLYHGFVGVDAGSGKTTKILAPDAYSSLPLLSPNGKELAYTAYDPAGPKLATGKPTRLTPLHVLNPNRVKIKNLTDKTSRSFTLLAPRLYFNLTWGPDSARLALKAVNPQDKTNTLVILDAATGEVTDRIKNQAGVFAWKKSQEIALAARVEGFSGTGIFSGRPIPARGVYLYNLKDKTYEKVYSDKLIQMVE
jgi:hypothetical protein